MALRKVREHNTVRTHPGRWRGEPARLADEGKCIRSKRSAAGVYDNYTFRRPETAFP